MEQAAAAAQAESADFWQSSGNSYWPLPVLLSCLAWLAIYLSDGQNGRLFRCYPGLSRNKQLEWHSRVASNLHAIFATAVGISCLARAELWAERQSGLRWEITLCLCVTAGYMLVDALFMFRYMRGSEMLQYQLHHVIGLAGSCAFLAQPSVHFFLSLRYITELSTPFVNQMWFFRTSGASANWPILSLANSLLLMASFIGTRILPLPWYWYLVGRELVDTRARIFWERPVAGVSWVLLALLIDCLNVFWTRKLLSGARKLVARHFAREPKAD